MRTFLSPTDATAVLKKLKPADLFPSFYNFLYQKIGNTVIGENVVIKGQRLQQIKVVGYNTGTQIKATCVIFFNQKGSFAI